ncbi:hypothetical protein OAF87_02730 [Akkermansiaceae bacterium]|nr:hypothetical protein [bacterium]MDB4740714.1 hypothetical protein [Akkermansiaceae bacterium]
MLDEVYIHVVPVIPLNDSRSCHWDKICDEMDFDETCLCNHFSDQQEAVGKLKEIKDWYSGLGETSHWLVEIRTICGLKMAIAKVAANADEYEDFRNIDIVEDFDLLYRWIESEALEDLKGATILDLYKSKQFLEDGEDDERDSLDFIDLEVAQRFLADPEAVALYEASGISDEAAEVLAKHQGTLPLQSLTELSDTASEALSAHQGQLALQSLIELSDAAAESLSKHRDTLRLDGLAELSDAALESLCKNQGSRSLGGLTELSDSAVKILSNHKGELSLDGLTELSDADAESLSKHEGGLALNGLTELSDTAAESLSRHQGTIDLGSLAKINSPSLAAVMREPELFLSVTNLLPDVASELWEAKALKEYQEETGYDGMLDLPALKELSLDTLKVLVGYSGHLNIGIESLSVDEARVLSEFSGAGLSLSEVAVISDQVAEALAECKADHLILSGLTSLSDAAAESLSKHEGELNLDGLTDRELVNSQK